MEEIIKDILTSFFVFAFGLASGVILEKYREKKSSYQKIVKDYIDGLNSNKNLQRCEYQRFAHLQRAGAFVLTEKELKKFEEDIISRGFSDPFKPWRDIVGKVEGFPKSFLTWASSNRIDFSDENESAKAVIFEYEVNVAPPKKVYAEII